MKTARVLQQKYNKVYAAFRNYIWDITAVEALAELEVETYKTFPDTSIISSKLQNLKRIVTASDIYKDDEELQTSFSEFEEDLADTDNVYAMLETFKEVVPV